MFKNFIDVVGIDNIVVIMCSLVSFLGGILLAKIKQSSPIKQEVYKIQFEQIYFPIFRFMEPFLYKKIDDETKNQLFVLCDKIFQNNYQYVKSSTLNSYNIFRKNFNNRQSYIAFTKNIDWNYEYLKLKLKLPRRITIYRMNNRQYPNNKISKVVAFLYLTVVVIIVTVIFMTIFIIFFALLDTVLNYISNYKT